MADLPAAAKRYISEIEDVLDKLKPENKSDLFQAVVDAPFKDKSGVIRFDLGITVLLLVNKSSKTIDRIALSKTSMASGAVRMSAKPFKAIKIPLDAEQNIIAKAIKTGQTQKTSDWHDLFVPDLTAQQARFNQSGAGIECSVVSKLKVKDGGAMIFSFYQPLDNLKDFHYDFVEKYSLLAERFLNKHVRLL